MLSSSSLLPHRPHGFLLLFYHLPILLMLFSAVCAAETFRTKAPAETSTEPGTIAVRSAADYAALIALDEPEQLTIIPVGANASSAEHAGAKKAKKIPERYDVSKIGVRHVDNGVNFYSMDREMAMGREMAQEWESQSQMLEDAAVNQYINALAQRLVRHSDAKVPFTVKVVNDDEVNAFALPGGYFYINTGLILAAQNEAELAGVMAHEIAHVAARHATRGLTKAQLWNIASIPILFVGGPIGMAVREVTSVAFPMSTLKFGRDAEREADLLGLQYAYAAGYDPVAFVNFFERLQGKRKKPNFMAKAFATHPMNEDRIRRAQAEINTMLPPHDEYVVDTSDFDEVQGRLLQLMNSRPLLSRNGGPVLRRRTEEPAPKDDGRPELKRR